MIEHWKRCAFYTNSAMQFATGAIYVSGTAHGENAEKVGLVYLCIAEPLYPNDFSIVVE